VDGSNEGARGEFEHQTHETPVRPGSDERPRPSGFDARLASGGTAGILAIFAALVIPVLFGAASHDFESAVSGSPGHLQSDWLLVAIVLLCAAFIGLGGASIGLLGLAGERGRNSAQIASAMALYAQATSGFVGLLAAAEVYCSTLKSSAAVVVLVCVVASVAGLGCMTVASLLVDSWRALPRGQSDAWISKAPAGSRHFKALTFIAWGLLLVVTLVKLTWHFSPEGWYPVAAAILVIFCAVVFLPVSVFRSLPRPPYEKSRPIKRWEAYLFGLAPALATSVLIIGLPLQ
jgi:hypothetical protein